MRPAVGARRSGRSTCEPDEAGLVLRHVLDAVLQDLAAVELGARPVAERGPRFLAVRHDADGVGRAVGEVTRALGKRVRMNRAHCAFA